jgi:inhibitor of growth protein 4
MESPTKKRLKLDAGPILPSLDSDGIYKMLHGLQTDLDTNLSRMRQLDLSSLARQRQIDRHTEKFIRNLISTSQPAGSIETNEILSTLKTQLGDEDANETLSASPPASTDSRSAGAACIRKLYQKALTLSDKKVKLAEETYSLVDRYVQEMDSKLQAFESELRSQNQSQSFASGTSPTIVSTADGKATTPNRKRRQPLKQALSRQESSSGGADGGTLAFSSISSLAESLLASASGAVGGLESTAAAGLVDMPVDPNEPTYCLCQQVSYGSMIACDSPECPIEWFHFGCVGIRAQPSGSWYCPLCAPSFTGVRNDENDEDKPPVKRTPRSRQRNSASGGSAGRSVAHRQNKQRTESGSND